MYKRQTPSWPASCSPRITLYLPACRSLCLTFTGTFAANSEVDGYQMLTNIDDASRLMRYPLGNITGWRLWLDKPLQVDTLSQQTLPPGTQWQDWRERDVYKRQTWARWKTSWRRKRMRWAPLHIVLLR